MTKLDNTCVPLEASIILLNNLKLESKKVEETIGIIILSKFEPVVKINTIFQLVKNVGSNVVTKIHIPDLLETVISEDVEGFFSVFKH